MKVARVVAVLLTVLSLFVVSRLRLSKDLTELFPSTPEATALARVTRVFGGGDVALVLLRGPDAAETERAASEAASRLRACAPVSSVIERPPAPEERRADPTGAWRWAGPVARARLARALTPEGMRARLHETRALLLAPGSSASAELLARDPLRLSAIPWEGRVEVASGARAAPGSAFVADEGRARLLVIEPRGSAFDPGEAARFTDAAEAALDGVRRAHPGVRVDLTGGHVVARQTERMIRRDLTTSGALSLVLASVVFLLTFRRPRALVAVLPPLVAGTLWTTALAWLLYPRLSAVATAFAAVVVGVGVDTGVHVYGRLLEARREGKDPREAAAVARRETWRPTLGAALAAGAAFACLALSDVAGMRQLGVLCGAGEVLTALAILVAVPEIGAWLERGAPPRALRMPAVAALTATRPRALVTLGLACAAVAAAVALGAPKLAHGVVASGTDELPAMKTYAAIDATFGGTRGQLVVVSADRDEARARARADAVAEAAETLLAQGTIAGFDALAQVAPSPALQRVRLAERDALDLPSRAPALAEALSAEGLATDAFAPALAALRAPTHEVADAARSDDPIVRWLVRRHLGHDARGTVAVTYVRLTGHPEDDARARTVLRAADPEAVLTGFPELARSLDASLARDLPRVLAAALGVVLLVLGALRGRVRDVLLALSVLVVEIAVVLLAARALGVRWHVYDALVLPVLLGITLDEVLFLLDANARRADARAALAEQAPLATATALTTAAGFGSLAVCRFGGLVDLGIVGALGSVIGLACALVLVPAGLRASSAQR